MLLSECAWGRLEPGPAWAPVGRLAGDRPAGDPQLMTYRSFLDSFALPDDGGGGGSGDRRASLDRGDRPDRKAARLDLKRRFTEPGHPGAMFRSVFDVLTARLAALEEACCAGARAGTCAHGHAVLRPRVLPSFFNLLLHLQAQKRDFTIILRSFGTDLPAVVDEINRFACGRHPAYPHARLDGSDGRVDVRVPLPAAGGAFVRRSSRPDGSALLLGAPRALLEAAKYGRADLDAALAATPGARLLTSMPAIHAALAAPPLDGVSRALAVRDYYPFWRATGESGRGGKLFTVEGEEGDAGDARGADAAAAATTAAPSADPPVSIFFDDNVGHTAANIVDARSPLGRCIPFADARAALVRVEPVGAILDDAFFVRAVHEASAAIAGRGRGRASARGRELWRAVRARLLVVVRLRAAARQHGLAGGA